MSKTIRKRLAFRPRSASESARERRACQQVSVGYVPCACPTCFETAIGEHGAMCWLCEESGCDGKSDCSKDEQERFW